MILVTGAAGFIGFHLSRTLLQKNEAVIGLDNFSAYYDVALKQERINILNKYENFIFVESCLTETRSWDTLFSQYPITKICHLAAQAGVRYSLENPRAYGDSNLTGFLEVLEAGRHNRVERLVYASSSSVYGGNTKIPFSETDTVDTPVSLYAATKKANELLAHSYTSLYDMQTIGLRFFTVYGPWGRPDMAYWKFTRALLEEETLTVYNRGNMERDFTYIDDIIQGVEAALFATDLNQYEVFNLGNNTPVRLMDFISLLETHTGKTARMEFLPMQPGDVPRTYADISRAREKLAYSPETGIRDGLEHFVTWYKNYFNY
ncbi:MAG: NAD-dependent epimerase/dehydratase family protein [Fibrobacterota bacterium]